MKIRKFPLFAKILAGMVAGLVVGFILLKTGNSSFVSDWIKPWGTIFIKLLKLIAIPLVFVSLVKGISGMKDLKKLSKLGLKTVSLYLATSFFAVSLGIGVVSLVKPGSVFSKSESEFYKQKFSTENQVTPQVEQRRPMDFIVEMVPENLFAAAGDNRNMLQIILVAVLTGVAIVLLGNEKTSVFVSVISATEAIVLKIIDFIMQFAPLGVFALLAGLVIDFSGDSAMFSALGMYSITVIGCLLFLGYIFYPVFLKIITKKNIVDYLKAIFPIQLLAFSTSSSSATLPFTMEQSQRALGISEETASFVLPLGATINMDGTSCYQAIVVIFIAQIFGIELSFTQYIMVLLLTILASIGTAGVPGASVVMTVMVMSSVGIPVEGLALILGIDRPLDMLRTVVNVTGDTFVASVVEGKKKS
ncbi:MAG: dicarboxylate/amino acid:cation symporter [Paludibacter sp.]|nr:dicarboxylate/amino acid:cation symporter [Paludibacter sp.]